MVGALKWIFRIFPSSTATFATAAFTFAFSSKKALHVVAPSAAVVDRSVHVPRPHIRPLRSREEDPAAHAHAVVVNVVAINVVIIVIQGSASGADAAIAAATAQF